MTTGDQQVRMIPANVIPIIRAGGRLRGAFEERMFMASIVREKPGQKKKTGRYSVTCGRIFASSPGGSM